MHEPWAIVLVPKMEWGGILEPPHFYNQKIRR